ncbi:alcohol dehydrogenase [Actinomycetes bacterium]|nr:alcohol dehydrogenase [Actinomycetes bacterium]
MIPSRGFAALTARAPLAPWKFDRRSLGDRDVKIDIQYSGICHSDIHQAREEWGPAIFPMVPGHEIAGIVSAVGSLVRKFKIGDPIGVGVFVDSCRKCASCNSGDENYCEKNMTATYNDRERDGITPTYGGYSNNFVVHEDYAVLIPKNLELSGVAPLLCAGITLYSPMKHWNVNSKSNVAIMGLGGLGHMGLKFAKALGARVTVLSHSAAKENDAYRMGADNFLLSTDSDALLNLKNSFDLIFNTVSAEHDINIYLNTLKLNGTVVIIGLPGKPFSVNAGILLGARRSMAGSMIGGMKDLQEMIDFCGEQNILSEVEIVEPAYINEAFTRTVASDVRYRFVVDATKF